MLIRLLRQAFSSGGKDGRYRATALVYDVRVKIPRTDTKTDDGAIALDHKDGYSVVVYLPCRLDTSNLVTGELFDQERTVATV